MSLRLPPDPLGPGGSAPFPKGLPHPMLLRVVQRAARFSGLIPVRLQESAGSPASGQPAQAVVREAHGEAAGLGDANRGQAAR